MLRNAVGGWGVSALPKKALRRCKVQRYYRYEGVGGDHVTLEWPLIEQASRGSFRIDRG